eukprot:GHVU01140135.1.p1 GENE.GHVU01140135.1~~GHVU01140135.1.p1  ORF type:complete len:300 (-),score=41.22 GHVU01140135.1:169-1068(-)
MSMQFARMQLGANRRMPSGPADYMGSPPRHRDSLPRDGTSPPANLLPPVLGNATATVKPAKTRSSSTFFEVLSGSSGTWGPSAATKSYVLPSEHSSSGPPSSSGSLKPTAEPVKSAVAVGWSSTAPPRLLDTRSMGHGAQSCRRTQPEEEKAKANVEKAGQRRSAGGLEDESGADLRLDGCVFASPRVACLRMPAPPTQRQQSEQSVRLRGWQRLQDAFTSPWRLRHGIPAATAEERRPKGCRREVGSTRAASVHSTSSTRKRIPLDHSHCHEPPNSDNDLAAVATGTHAEAPHLQLRH